MQKIKLKRNDVVRIIAGKHKGVEGPILKINKKNLRVTVKGIVNLKHEKPSQKNEEGGIKEIDSSVHISNVALINPKNKKEITKVAFKINSNGKKVRIAKKSNTEIVEKSGR